ncbi:hydroxyacid-oxoacid transhydrogenase [Mumia zhuanghuii]|uniref:hydroxyacid-oxoacid transhydrogenase n=1 Tax=Mumia zhuanghuii TaxID=2585211 RepID=A0A5C4MJC1_9ACTN|nr:hydroxyacid-oxoacid transhydrogenase [Mumia zhuanghuii]TNC33405.1 iron-containing alcohol dehydrogenase [Mumia zhuanghuii]TNC45216.1 iron-containing alcohol dehydrogenase [Mumia zhuanghuii]
MSFSAPTNPESIFTYGSPRLKFGAGASAELGYELASLGVRRALLVTDRGIEATGIPSRVVEQVAGESVELVVYADTHVEPTDASLNDAIAFARANGPFDAVVALGGGSSIDTAKAVNLLTTNEGDLMDYINVPVGAGRAPAKALLPLIAMPTTTGTGSESTTICVLDVLAQHVKTGISHARLRPELAIIDPELTLSQPAEVTAASGMDILCHALESYTARPFSAYERKRPEERVPYCGANPISDMWAEKSLTLLAASFRTAVREGRNVPARGEMALAATFAGMGFGNAGVHIPHANAYPIAGQVRGFRPSGYPQDEAMVPHGMAVSLTAPEAFRFTFDAAPERHVRAAELLDPSAERPADLADFLPSVLVRLMRDIGIPAGIGAVGFDKADIASLVEGTMKQQRLLATAPKPVGADDVTGIFERSISLW